MWAATTTWTWSMSGALRDVDGSNGKLVFRSQFGLINFCFSLHISSPIFALPFLLLCFHFGFVLHHVLYERVSTYSFQFLAGMMSIMNSFLSLSLSCFLPHHLPDPYSGRWKSSKLLPIASVARRWPISSTRWFHTAIQSIAKWNSILNYAD